MRPAILLIVLSVITTAAHAQWEANRTITGRRISIKPLFDWWSKTQSISESNRLLKAEEQIPLPKKAFSGWVLVTASAKDMQVDGHYMLVEAKLVYSPADKATNAFIALKNAPVTSKKKFDSAMAELKQTENNRARAASRAASYEQAGQNYNDRANQYYEMSEYTGSRGLANAANANSKAAGAAFDKAKAADREAERLARREQQILQATGGGEFELNDFALRTTEQYKGYPVYDLGYPFGR